MDCHVTATAFIPTWFKCRSCSFISQRRIPLHWAPQHIHLQNSYIHNYKQNNTQSTIRQLLQVHEIIWALIPLWFFWRILKRLKGSGFPTRLNNSVELSQTVDLNSDALRWSILLLSVTTTTPQTLHTSQSTCFSLHTSEQTQDTDGTCLIWNTWCATIHHDGTVIWSD